MGQEYAPGWGADMTAMLSARTAHDRSGFVLPLLRDGDRVLDVGCGPGSITRGLARAVAPGGFVDAIDIEGAPIDTATRLAATAGLTNVRFQVADATDLPFGAASFDVVFAHALFEHLASPPRALAEMWRVLRPGGVLAVCSSDWSGARIEPETADVVCAMRAHYALRRRAGGDPFAGGRLADWVTAAGFSTMRVAAAAKVDMTYATLANYVGERIRRSLSATSSSDPFLEQAAGAASRWASRGDVGTVLQCWVHVLARR